MRIAQIAPLFESVPPQRYGGTERVVHYLTEGLVRRGHDVTLFATGDSRTRARLIAAAPRALRGCASVEDAGPYLARHLGHAFARADEFDLIHSHADFMAVPYALLTRTPVLHTMHGRMDLRDLPVIYEAPWNIDLISISDAQRAGLPNAGWRATVYHGLPPDLYRFSPSAEDYLLFLGRISPEKRPDLAIEAAIRAGVRLLMAAKIDPKDQSYFETEVAPRLQHPLIEFLGEVDDAEKQILLGRTRALLTPVDWPEPFGLNVIEALACGTPVIARPCGALPELIAHGETGFLETTLDGLVEAIGRLGEIDRARCRLAFEKRFTDDVMVERYLEVYRDAIHRRAHGGAATAA